jgi:hypothetical protein
MLGSAPWLAGVGSIGIHGDGERGSASAAAVAAAEQKARMAFGMPETDLSSHGNVENLRNLTFWHLACQK